MVNVDSINIEVAYASIDKQIILPMTVSKTCDVRGAIELSGLLQQFSEIDLMQHAVGFFGKVVKLDRILKSGDRVEIYRPLTMDPMQARKLRAKKQQLK